MGRLAAAVTDNAIWGFLKRAGVQRVRVIPEGGQARRSFSFCFSSGVLGLGRA